MPFGRRCSPRGTARLQRTDSISVGKAHWNAIQTFHPSMSSIGRLFFCECLIAECTACGPTRPKGCDDRGRPTGTVASQLLHIDPNLHESSHKHSHVTRLPSSPVPPGSGCQADCWCLSQHKQFGGLRRSALIDGHPADASPAPDRIR